MESPHTMNDPQTTNPFNGSMSPCSTIPLSDDMLLPTSMSHSVLPLSSDIPVDDVVEDDPESQAEIDVNDETFWEVKRIDGKKKFYGNWHYKVTWADDSSTWEPITNLENCPLAIREFEAQMSRKRSRRSKSEEKRETSRTLRQRPPLSSKSRTTLLNSDSDPQRSPSPVRSRGRYLLRAMDTSSDSEESSMFSPPKKSSTPLKSAKDGSKGFVSAIHDSDSEESPSDLESFLSTTFCTPPHLSKCYSCGRGPPTHTSKSKRKKSEKNRLNSLKDDPNLSDDEFLDISSDETLLFCSKCTCSMHETCLPSSGLSKKKPRLAEYLVDGSFICVKCRDQSDCPICLESNSNLNPSLEALPIQFTTLFRCSLCSMVSHWPCMAKQIVEAYDRLSMDDNDSDNGPMTLAEALCEMSKTFVCATCLIYSNGVDRILTFRTNEKSTEYLVKFKNTSYRELNWVSETWLRGTHMRLYRSFQRMIQEDLSWPKPEDEVVSPLWKRVDRILDVSKNHYFVKWMGRPYSEATWESNLDLINDADAIRAFANYEQSQNLGSEISQRNAKAKLNDLRPNPKSFELLKKQPAGLAGGTLKPYQLEGLNWLLGNWCARTPCILADEMGLGKTIQLIAFLIHLFHEYSRFPFLLVVPNSTLDNWSRELGTWAPQLFVVTSTGTREDRKMIQKYNIFKASNSKSLKCHVVLTSYESVLLTTAFKEVHWDVLIVDEGHRLKNDKSKLFTFLKEFKVAHKILLTGTPLQNNIRELFNLMHFMDPEHFQDPELLASTYNMENSEEAKKKIDELHGLLLPHFLRRVKSDVLKDLPAKAEILVPVRMTQLQRELIKDIYSSNFELLKALGKNAALSKNTKTHLIRSTSLMNILMQCRKVLSHPFLLPEVEEGLGLLDEPDAIHKRLVDSGGKLELLSQMLPKLKEQGHKVLIFSQFKTTLDILEDFLTGCEWEYFRFDGDTARSLRQEYIDSFNASPNKFVFLLTTRAGGVGLNLTSADTVIIYDTDWNPHQDVQAIARCHRIGQTRPVLAFKLMTVASVEEKMINVGLKKMALDHIVVQKMKESTIDEHDLIEVLRFGAHALFEEDTSQIQKYNDEDLDRLLDRSQAKPYAPSPNSANESGNGGNCGGFGFAKVWLEKRMDEPVLESAEEDWDEILKKLRKDNSEKVETQGRRKRKTVNYASAGVSPLKKRKSSQKAGDNHAPSESDASLDTANEEDSDHNTVVDEQELNAELSDLLSLSHKKFPLPPPLPLSPSPNGHLLKNSTSDLSKYTESTSANVLEPAMYPPSKLPMASSSSASSASARASASKGRRTGRPPTLPSIKKHISPLPSNSSIAPFSSSSTPSTMLPNPHYSYLLSTPAPERTPRSPGGLTANSFASQSPCWICDGSIYSGVSYHLPIQCPALNDRDFLVKRLRNFYAYFPESSRPAQFFLQKMIQRTTPFCCLICQSTAHHDVTYCPINRNLDALLAARDRILSSGQKNSSWTEDLGKIEMFIRLAFKEQQM